MIVLVLFVCGACGKSSSSSSPAAAIPSATPAPSGPSLLIGSYSIALTPSGTETVLFNSDNTFAFHVSQGSTHCNENGTYVDNNSGASSGTVTLTVTSPMSGNCVALGVYLVNYSVSGSSLILN